MKIIAESGSTTTEWVLVDGKNVVERSFTEGINPFFQTRREISHSIRLNLPEAFFKKRWELVYFYGAGCANLDKKNILEASLVAQFKTPISAESDLLAAARGMLIDKPGIACILGTGSNSCLYDGERIIKNVRSAGYILGDEGSGAAMGRRFLSDYLKNLAPKELCDAFYEKFKVTPDEILDSIYNHPFPNRSLSTFSYFLKDHLDNKYAFNLVYEELMRFFQRNIIQYDYKSYPVFFMGNLAYTYADILDLVAKDFGLNIEKTEKSPMRGLIEYHSIYG